MRSKLDTINQSLDNILKSLLEIIYEEKAIVPKSFFSHIEPILKIYVDHNFASYEIIDAE